MARQKPPANRSPCAREKKRGLACCLGKIVAWPPRENQKQKIGSEKRTRLFWFLVSLLLVSNGFPKENTNNVATAPNEGATSLVIPRARHTLETLEPFKI